MKTAFCFHAGPPTKFPRKKLDYSQDFEYVLPSARVIAREKHMQAIQQERKAALAILDASPDDKVTIHYDTTTRRRIAGEWTSIIIRLASGKMFRMRPLSLALETRENITHLMVEIIKRLSLATSGSASKKELWSKVFAFMTDSVAKKTCTLSHKLLQH